MDFISYYFQSYYELSVLQFETAELDIIECISLKEAQKNNQIIISELHNSGDLNNIVINNNSDKYVLIINGELINGTKYLRVINRSALLSPNTQNIIQVTYINERSSGTEILNFIGENSFIPFTIRSEISVKVSKLLKNLSSIKSIQSVGWGKIFDPEISIQESNDILAISKNEVSNLNSKVFCYAVDWRANGLALFYNNRLLSIDIFHNKQIFKDNFHKLIRGSLIDCKPIKLKNNKMTPNEALIKIKDILNRLSKVNHINFDSIGVGFENRFNFKKVTSFELNYKDHLIHLSALASPNYIIDNN